MKNLIRITILWFAGFGIFLGGAGPGYMAGYHQGLYDGGGSYYRGHVVGFRQGIKAVKDAEEEAIRQGLPPTYGWESVDEKERMSKIDID